MADEPSVGIEGTRREADTIDETTVMPSPAPEAAEAEEGPREAPEETAEPDGAKEDAEPSRRRRWASITIAAALAAVGIGAGVGAWAGTHATTPTKEPAPVEAPAEAVSDAEEEQPEPAKALGAITVDEAAALVNGMALPTTSKVNVEVADRTVVVTKQAELVARLVPERAWDRATELASLVGENRAAEVTWVIDNGRGASAAVSVEVTDEAAAEPVGVADKLASAVGYALDEGAYEAVRDQVAEPTAGALPVGADGEALVEPAKPKEQDGNEASTATKADATDASKAAGATSSRTPSSSTSGTGANAGGTSSASSANASGSSATTPGRTGAGTTGNNNGSSSSGSSGNTGTSGAGSITQPTKRWVDEVGHWEDTYEERQVKVGERWVVDSEAWDETTFTTVAIYVTSDGMEFTSTSELADYMMAKLLYEGINLSSGVVERQVESGTIHHEEVGHYEDVNETQMVKTGSEWVVDVAGHWE